MLVLGAVTSIVLASHTTFESPFSNQLKISAEFESAPATNPNTSQTVTIAGVVVGKVAGWHVTNRGTAMIQMDIDRDQAVYANARAVLRSVNPLNQMYIDINPGNPSSPRLADGAIIPMSQTMRPIQPDEVLQHLDSRSQQALTALMAEEDTALAHAPEQLPAGLSSTDRALVDLRPAVAALQERRDNLAQLVTALSEIASAAGGNRDRAMKLASSAQETLTVLARNDDNLRRSLDQLPGMNNSLREALSSTQNLTKQLLPTLKDLDSASDDLPSALSRLRSTARQIDDTVDAGRPLLREARPVIEDLRSFTPDLRDTLEDLRPITRDLDRDTSLVVSYLPDISAFVYNTRSVFSTSDARGPLVRAHLVVPLPDGGALAGARGGYAPHQKPSRTPPRYTGGLLQIPATPLKGK
jgi:phospholipid/cholesterol/gamma-HCH transport system substrate-binding protein